MVIFHSQEMSMHRYAPPLPYGGWVLSLAILFTGFFIFRTEGADESLSEAEHLSRTHGDEQEGRAQSTPSQAYQTDEEASRGRKAERRRRKKLRRGSSSRTPLVQTPPSTTSSTLFRPTVSPGDRRYDDEKEPEEEGHPAVFVAAATVAANAVRKSHFAHLDAADRWRVEREAFRVRVHEHVQRELRRRSVEAAGALASVL